MPFYHRNLSIWIRELMLQFPVVALIGARQIGKTTLAEFLAPDFKYIDLEKPSHYDRLANDTEFFFKQYPKKVIFDEAQSLPVLFPVLRGIIDERRGEKGRFILTGSSSPELLENISETLAGRVAIVELGTLKANEYYHLPLSPFYQIFKQKLSKDVVSLTTPALSFKQVQQFWFKGGYPEPISQSSAFYQNWMNQYEATYINRDIARLFPRLDKIAYRRFLKMLGKLSGQIINRSNLARAIGISEPTIQHYLEIASGTFLWRQLPSFTNHATKSLIKMPKGHIRDTGLLHHILHINSLDDLENDPIVGFSFEGFVIEELLKGLQDAQIQNVECSYYRTRSGAEIDLILQGNFGLLPIEIKYGSTLLERQLRTLKAFIKQHQLPLGIVINQSDQMEWISEDILQVPVGCL
jgi:uncharacterized protein